MSYITQYELYYHALDLNYVSLDSKNNWLRK